MTSNFTDLGLAEPLLRAIAAENYDTPTPIQAQAIPYLMEGKDLLGIAQTGTGKTAAFALPILHRLSANPIPRKRGAVRTLVLTPTRELAVQITESFRTYGRHLGLRTTMIFGGVGQQPQVEALSRGVDILVATPGRLLDLINQRHADLRAVEIFVLDEADRMLDMGFIHDVKKIVATLPKQRQTLFFSATMPGEIERLANGILTDPIRVTVTPPATTVDRIDQRVYFVDQGNKAELLTHLLNDQAISRVLVFTRTKHGADRVTKHVERVGINAQAIHGNKSQTARQRALNDFRDGKTRVLIATDIAARGIDIDGITHVINYEIPEVPETYVHRIGRTARAGRDGIALTFCDRSEKSLLRDVEKLTRRPLDIVADHGFHAVNTVSDAEQSERSFRPRNGQRNGGQRSGGQRSDGPRGNGQRPHRQGQGQGGPRSNEPRSSEQRSSEQRGTEQRPATDRSADFRRGDFRQNDYRQNDDRPSDRGSANHRSADQRPADHRGATERSGGYEPAARDRDGQRPSRPHQGQAEGNRSQQDRPHRGRPQQGAGRQDRPEQGRAQGPQGRGRQGQGHQGQGHQERPAPGRPQGQHRGRSNQAQGHVQGR